MKNVHHEDIDDEMCKAAREYCALAYQAETGAEILTRPVHDVASVDSVATEEGHQSPPPRSRRNAMDSSSQVDLPSVQLNPPEDHTEAYLVPGTAEHAATSENLLQQLRDRRRPLAVAGIYPTSSPQMAAPQISMPIPHVASPNPQVAMPTPQTHFSNGQPLYAEHNWPATSSWFPDNTPIYDTPESPHNMSTSVYPTSQTPQYIHQLRHHPYEQASRERPFRSIA